MVTFKEYLSQGKDVAGKRLKYKLGNSMGLDSKECGTIDRTEGSFVYFTDGSRIINSYFDQLEVVDPE